MPIDLDKQFKEEREPLIEYEVVQDESKDPFVPAKLAEPTPPEQILVKIEL